MDRIFHYVAPPAGALFLDAGCGTGDHSIRIAQRGYECFSVDISETVLRRAEKKIEQQAAGSKVHLSCQALENLAFAENTFDCVHCRGVLMHIPDWQAALANLCRVLKPGGKIVIVEGSKASLDAVIVQLGRLVMKRQSRLVETAGGLEFWSNVKGSPFLVRMANINYLVRQLNALGIRHKKSFTTEFLGIGRVPAGIVRNSVITSNRLCFALHFPSFLSNGVALIGEKLPAFSS
jgi:ubiquinone/menaquinone biosynthesis C-methylase UbiE